MSKREPLKIGDRVRVYDGEKTHKGTIVEIGVGYARGLIDVDIGCHVETFSCFQLRRLKTRQPKAKMPRVERWAVFPAGGGSPVIQRPKPGYCAPGGRIVHIVELRPGERVLSEKDLAEAWDRIRKDESKRQFFGTAHCAAVSYDYDELAQALNFPSEDA